MIDIEKLDLWNQPDEGDPLVWLREYRDGFAKEYPTAKAASEYYRQVGTVAEALAEVREKIAEQKRLQTEPQS
jgi:hypothetical protein